MSNNYTSRVAQQIEQYRGIKDIHELPEIFHYWSNKYLRERLNSVIGADSIAEFYANALIRVAQRQNNHLTFVSLGTGACEVEISVTKALLAKGVDSLKFNLRCIEISPLLTERAIRNIAEAKLDDYISVTQMDLNDWSPPSDSIDAVIANHSLHHMVELEKIFDAVQHSLRKEGAFITNDMIGRNGHMRWPEAKVWIDAMWPMLPEKAKYNNQLKRMESTFLNHDCSNEGFEGIRAQDILPLLVERFDFEKFLAYGGLPDIFIDRGFGHNFDASSDSDRGFIDFVQFLNDKLIAIGEIKPTMMFAEMRLRGCSDCHTQYLNLSPEFCIRHTTPD